MKFIYIDESGSPADGDVFVMCGLMVDAYKLRKKTADFDRKLGELLARYPGSGTELKTSRFINGKGGWSQIPPHERKDFLTNICRLAVANGGKLFGIGLSFQALDEAKGDGHGHPFGDSYWLAGGMFTACLVQKKMQGIKGGKGLTVVIMDDNKAGMPQLSDGLYQADVWYDGLYQVRGKNRGKSVWFPRTGADRLDQIINTAFAIKSDHSSLVQVADAICYVYRRHLELTVGAEAYPGEQAFYEGLVGILEPQRDKLGHTPDEPSAAFYRAAVHEGWAI
ncbi:DUF3800 domain-containing protein [Sulfitobacter sabulilitoris]|uniref:DUF3800 domain-containing protein n=1 Tax=Sulfitobacter sabulilitoris TaxID=2562655 RepID=A0A5S3PID7_9RHOB|nr:DUF3800 domain-containing protein [Sulfitobacter sabulilitoris]TMM54114.1 DUF3800 domain-containing protein [Sulfitobacter sabulilitoris]